jgi:hypothetical protein
MRVANTVIEQENRHDMPETKSRSVQQQREGWWQLEGQQRMWWNEEDGAVSVVQFTVQSL